MEPSWRACLVNYSSIKRDHIWVSGITHHDESKENYMVMSLLLNAHAVIFQYNHLTTFCFVLKEKRCYSCSFTGGRRN